MFGGDDGGKQELVADGWVDESTHTLALQVWARECESAACSHST